MKVTIDPSAGFCFGVKNTIELAEKALENQNKLYCIGDIVHNQEEINRLQNLGLEITNFDSLPKDQNSIILFRAHGEPSSSYNKINQKGLNLIDGTCSIVLKLQQKVTDAYIEMNKTGGQVVIYGSKNHPEVMGLSGYTNDKAIVLESVEETDLINFNKPIRLFAQTTKDKKKYKLIQETIDRKILENGATTDYKYYNTICGQVSNRVPKLKEFCSKNEVVVFVSGRKSSNGKYLFDICKSTNSNSYLVSTFDEIKPGWFNHAKTVGVSGATSTPLWLMEKIAEKIKIF